MSLADIIFSPRRYKFDATGEAAVGAAQEGDVETAKLLSQVLEVDVTLSQEHVFGFEVSSSPVEEGINITDHKRRRPVVLRMSGLVSDSPNNVREAVKMINLVAAGRSKSQDAYETLIAIANRPEPIIVTTHLGVFRNMTFTDFSVQKNDSGKYIGFSATLQEVRFAQPEFGSFAVDVEASAAPSAFAAKEPGTISNGSILTAIDKTRVVDSFTGWVKAGIDAGVKAITGSGVVP